MIILHSLFAKARLGFHFKYIFFIHSEFQSYEKWNENEMENDGKMSGKWPKNGYPNPTFQMPITLFEVQSHYLFL